MKLQDYIKAVSPAILSEAEKFIQSGDFISLKSSDCCYEGIAAYENGVIFPEAVIDENREIKKYWCDCGKNNTVCVHIAAVFLGIEKMLQAGCSDYHEAVKNSKICKNIK